MALNAAHWSIDRATGNIRYIGDDHTGAAPSYATVIEFHRWLQDLADDPEFTGNDELDIIDNTPSDRATDNLITLINGGPGVLPGEPVIVSAACCQDMVLFGSVLLETISPRH